MKQTAETIVDKATYDYIVGVLVTMGRPDMIRSIREQGDGSIRIEYLDEYNDAVLQLIEEAGAEEEWT